MMSEMVALPTTITKPFLKWVGGKTQVIETVLSSFPREIKNYYEPFLGGGSVLLGLLSYIEYGRIKVSGTIYAGDINHALIGLYKNIQSHPEEFIREVNRLTLQFRNITGDTIHRKPSTLQEAYTSQESFYYWIRSQYNQLSFDEKTGLKASAMLLFMNKTCFRGLYRESTNGFNVPYGNYKNPSILDEEHIRRVSTLIKNVVFISTSYEYMLEMAMSGDFVYLDPPYVPDTQKSFVSYTADGFTLDHHKTLFRTCHLMCKNGIKMLLSNADVELVNDSFPSSTYTKIEIVCKRAIHSKKPNTTAMELLITNNVGESI